MTPLTQTRFVRDFACLAERCDDTCCVGWGMQVDPATQDVYRTKAPELLAAVDGEGEDAVMLRDAANACVRLDAGLCRTHRDYGTEFLSDACHFFPRITRKLGARTVRTATLGCPATAADALFGERASEYHEGADTRLPTSLRDALPEAMDEDAAWQVHRAFLAAVDPVAGAARSLSRIVNVAHSLERQPHDAWASAAGFYLRDPDPRLPAAETNPADLPLLLQALCGIARNVPTGRRPRVDAVLADIAAALEMTFDGDGMAHPTVETTGRVADLESSPEAAAFIMPPLEGWLNAQLTITLFPYAGLGQTPGERALLLGLRFAFTRLALLTLPVRDRANAVRAVESLSRLLDHVADPALQLAILAETGWHREARMRGLAGDA